MDNVVTYLIITGISICPLALYNGCVTLFRAMGDSKMTIHISLLMNLMNLIGNICFKKRVTARQDMEQIKRILYIGIPNGLENSLYHLTPETVGKSDEKPLKRRRNEEKDVPYSNLR